MKTYVLLVSKYFPKYHEKAGQSTGFVGAISNLFNPDIPATKIHTIRENYKLWEYRINRINKGDAVLSVRYWSGVPYRSKQVEICVLEKVGIQKLIEPDNSIVALIDETKANWEEVAKNDGLSFYDFCEWFKNAGKQPMAIIHFTNFRYE